MTPTRRTTIMLAALACAACTPDRPPPPRVLFDGLPVSGDRAIARQTGFTQCLDTDAIHVRCRKHGVMLFGLGPFEAAVDLLGSEGQSGFDQLTLWNDDDQDAVYQIAAALKRRGWRYCYTGTEDRSDDAIFTRPGSNVRVSIDISYFSKRRARLIAASNPTGLDRPCKPDDSLLRFGRDIAKAGGE